MRKSKNKGLRLKDRVVIVTGGAAIFFASSGSDFIIGQTLVVNGRDVKH